MLPAPETNPRGHRNQSRGPLARRHRWVFVIVVTLVPLA